MAAAPIAIIAASLIGTGVAVRQGIMQGREAKTAAGKAEGQMNDAERKRQERERLALEQQSMAAHRATQRRNQALAGGFQSTVRSGSQLGLPGGGNVYGKPTLIGGGY